MAEILYGAPVADAIRERSKKESEALGREGVRPCLALVRIGDRADTASYAAGLKKNAPKSGVLIRSIGLPEDTSAEEAARLLEDLNSDPAVHGILLLLPLPAGLDADALRNRIAPEKDVDGATDLSQAGVFEGKDLGFAPATPRAVMEILHYYRIPVAGKRAVVIGRSPVVGRPLAMMLLRENATVTVCHSRTADLAAAVRDAEIVIAALGKPEAVGAGILGKDQILVDVGIHRKEDGTLCGDADRAQAELSVRALTPVPGGVGAVTTAVLLQNVLEAASRQLKYRREG